MEGCDTVKARAGTGLADAPLCIIFVGSGEGVPGTVVKNVAGVALLAARATDGIHPGRTNPGPFMGDRVRSVGVAACGGDPGADIFLELLTCISTGFCWVD